MHKVKFSLQPQKRLKLVQNFQNCLLLLFLNASSAPSLALFNRPKNKINAKNHPYQAQLCLKTDLRFIKGPLSLLLFPPSSLPGQKAFLQPLFAPLSRSSRFLGF